MPGVSAKISCAFSIFLIPRILFLVVWDFLEVIEIFLPKIWFNIVDLPTFGLPIIEI
jgi:hypothetical protein